MSDQADKQKTERIGWLCVTMVILGLFFTLTKTNACALACNSCNSHDSTPEKCKDEFYEIDTNNRYRNSHTCTPGARVEIVASPPAPKPGVLCHCTNSDQAAPATQDAGK